LILSACVTVQQTHETPPKVQGYTLVGEQSLEARDFEAVIDEAQRILSSDESESRGDVALFALGIVYAHPENPAKNSTDAIGFFARLIDEYPHSRWSVQAGIWLALLKDQQELAGSNERLQAENATLDRANKKLKDEQDSFVQTQKKLRDENDNLQQVIKQMKQVDIEIEEKKREKAR
jgi:hypothetical protein